MSEKDVENAFLNENFYSLLGYEGAGHDLRSEMTLPDNRRPDYITLDSNDGVTVVYEFKAPGRDLSNHTDQLFHYTQLLKADYGVLTNGESFRWFRREDRQRMDDVSMVQATDRQGNEIYAALRKPEWDIRNPEHVHEYIEELREGGVGLDAELGQEHFFDTFRLEERSPFAELVSGMMALVDELRDEQDNQFVTSAYNFWEALYASEPGETPESWEPFVNGDQELKDFMFCLESAHALLGRLLLAKATEDHEFFQGTAYNGMDDYFWGLQGFSSEINLEAYPVAAVDLIGDMRDQLVEGLFQDDIFIWWTEAYQEQLIRRHKSGANRFRRIAQEESSVERISKPTQERFSRAVAHIFFNVLRFDFSEAKGDLLGDLYQRYFDPETRKALGEFYTPQPVVEYIMDSVDYNRGISNERLMDPACGSGTFLVEAVQRYIEDIEYYHDNPDWEAHLRDLCSKPRIVGLDIHPFAVLMAQIRFVVAILPAYREAKSQNPNFTLSRLPIYRTDTLRNERELSGVDIGDDTRQVTLNSLTEDNRDVLIPTPLPIEVDEDDNVETEDGFLIRRVRMPKFGTIQDETGIENFDEYFAALQGVIDTVKHHVALSDELWEDYDWTYHRGLEANIARYTSRDYSGTEDFFEPYVNDMLEHVRFLQEEHDDGRLFKMLEDAVLSLVVKNYMEYDFVVGNPPYVNIKNILDSKQVWYKKLYESAYGRFDLYVLFLERGLEWLSESGQLGYITSNKFTRSRYGTNIRRIIGRDYSLAQYVEFGDIDVFADATNFASILVIDRDLGRELVPYAKVHEASDTDIFQEIREVLGKEEVLTPSLEVSTYPRAELDESNWRFTPNSVRKVEKRIRDNSDDTIGDVALGVREGVASGGDESFMISPQYAEERNFDDDLLWPIIRGKNVRRWVVSWDDELVIYPYDEDGQLVDLKQYPNIKSHLDSHEEDLRDRYCVRKGGKGIYEYHGPHPKSMFEGDFKIATPDMATENHFAYTDGFNCFKNTVYVLTFNNNIDYSEMELLGLLNSSIAEFSIKQTSPPLRGKPFRYRYKSQYVNQIPLPADTGKIEPVVEKILEIEGIQERVESFPESYIDQIDGEVEYIEYKWNTNRSSVSASIEETIDGGYTVSVGRTDTISAPQIDQGGDQEKQLRAEYVQKAVTGRSVDKNEIQEIPIPRNRADIDDLLQMLHSDNTELENASIDELESELDERVYELFGLGKKDREIIENYLEIF